MLLTRDVLRDGDWLYAAGYKYGGAGIYGFNLSTGAELSVNFGSETEGLALDPATRMLYVSSENGWIYKVDPNTWAAAGVADLGGPLGGIAFDAASGKLFVARSGSALVSVVPSTGASDTVEVGPHDPAF